MLIAASSPQILQADVVGDTVSPIEVSLSAGCHGTRFALSYRNTWLPKTGTSGVTSVSIAGREVPNGVAKMNASLKGARIESVSVIRCFAVTRSFLIAVHPDGGDAARLGLERVRVFIINRGGVRPEIES